MRKSDNFLNRWLKNSYHTKSWSKSYCSLPIMLQAPDWETPSDTFFPDYDAGVSILNAELAQYVYEEKYELHR